MSTQFLLDANVVSDFGNNRDWAGQIASKIFLYGINRCHVSAITWHELMFGLGALGPKRKADLSVIYNGFGLAAFDRAAALEAANVRRTLGAKGIDLPDALLAGHAIAGGFTLVSRNVKHFERVAGLNLVNWAT